PSRAGLVRSDPGEQRPNSGAAAFPGRQRQRDESRTEDAREIQRDAEEVRRGRRGSSRATQGHRRDKEGPADGERRQEEDEERDRRPPEPRFFHIGSENSRTRVPRVQRLGVEDSFMRTGEAGSRSSTGRPAPPNRPKERTPVGDPFLSPAPW